MTTQELREKCEQLAPAGCAVSMAVLQVLNELDQAHRTIKGLAGRVFDQCQLLSKRAERAAVQVPR